MKNGIIVTIDGTSGAGKSTSARLLAGKLGFLYLDSGSLYRAIGWKVLKSGRGALQCVCTSEKEIERICDEIHIDISKSGEEFRIIVDRQDITEDIRGPEVSKMASYISALPIVRKRLFKLQKDIGEKGNVVIEGRDIGTVIFPNADIKFYLDAYIKTRGERRWRELRAKGLEVDLDATIAAIEERDRNDSTRVVSPLKIPEGAIFIDTTEMSLSQVVDLMLDEIKKRAADR